jgi:hypothetical protein
VSVQVYQPSGGTSGGGAPTTAQYVTLVTDAGLSAERTLAVGAAGAGLSLTDAGANNAVTIAIANEQWGPCTADTTVNNSTTVVNVTGMTFTIGASATEIWQFEVQCLTVAASAASDWKFGLTVPASATYRFGYHSATPTTDSWGLDTGTTQIALSTTTIALGSFVGTGGVFFRGFVFGGGTGGTVQLQFAQNTLTVADSTIKKGSLLIARKSIA